MRKNIAKVIRESAEKLPIIYEWEDGSTIMKGWELNLSALGEKNRFDKDKDYEVYVPQMRAVTHDQQIKDAYKKSGTTGVKQYIDKVFERAKEIVQHG